MVARRTAITLASKLGFGPVDRTKVATAVSELARNIVMYAGNGEVRLQVTLTPRISLTVEGAGQRAGHPQRRSDSGWLVHVEYRPGHGPARRALAG